MTHVSKGREPIRFPTESVKEKQCTGYVLTAENASNASKHPLVIYVHGLGGNAAAEATRQFTDYFRVHAITSLALNLPGHGEPAFMSAGSKESALRLDANVACVKKAIEYAASRQDILLEKIYLYGTGSGGPIALATAVQDERIKAVATRSCLLDVLNNTAVHKMIHGMFDPRGTKHLSNPHFTADIIHDMLPPAADGEFSYITQCAKQLKERHLPVMYCFSTYDQYIPLEHQLRLAQDLCIPTAYLEAMIEVMQNHSRNQSDDDILRREELLMNKGVSLANGIMDLNPYHDTIIWREYFGADNPMDNKISKKRNYFENVIKNVTAFFIKQIENI
ncbi:MAG: hypothetical protein V1725_00505 [archaeon]